METVIETTIETRRCRSCKDVKSISEFATHKTHGYPLKLCTECHTISEQKKLEDKILYNNILSGLVTTLRCIKCCKDKDLNEFKKNPRTRKYNKVCSECVANGYISGYASESRPTVKRKRKLYNGLWEGFDKLELIDKLFLQRVYSELPKAGRINMIIRLYRNGISIDELSQFTSKTTTSLIKLIQLKFGIRYCPTCKRVRKLDAFRELDDLSPTHPNEIDGYLFECIVCENKRLRRNTNTVTSLIMANPLIILEDHYDKYSKFDIFSAKFGLVEDIRRSPLDVTILQVRCSYCGKWIHVPASMAHSRSRSIHNVGLGENRFYCSEYCKHLCPIYNRSKYYKSFDSDIYREVQPELRIMVFERDGWRCIRCKSVYELTCHHIEGVVQNPIESADIDICATLCRTCHLDVHREKGCTPYDYRCDT